MKTSILFMIFNRPDKAAEVFEQIRRVKPKKLFIAADGPRKEKIGERELCIKTRHIVNRVDWDCEIKTLFREENLGCGKAVSGAINWFFENVDEGIILEDDCLPDPSFFRFCEELLEKYRYDENKFMISGCNLLPEELRPKESYYFSKIAHIWGWATWKRSWQKYDFQMRDFHIFLKNKTIEKIWKNKKTQDYWLEKFYETHSGKLDTWDYQWIYSIWKNTAVSIAPRVNLISNIGFNSMGTHTSNKNDPSSNKPLEKMEFPLTENTSGVYSIGDDYENQQLSKNNNILKKILKKMGLFNLVKNIYLSITRKL